MAKNVTAVQLGGQPQTFEANTVQEIMTKLGLSNVSIKVNGQTVEPSHTLSDYQFVAFGEKVKGGYELLTHWSHV